MDPNALYNCRNELPTYTRERLWLALDNAASERRAVLTSGDLDHYRETLRTQLLDTLGIESAALAQQASVAGELLEVLHDNGLILEKQILPAEIGPAMTALVYRREDLQAPAPGLLFLCGHDHAGKAAPEYQLAARIFARAGFVVLVIDPPGQGERLQYPDDIPEGADSRFFGPGTSEHTLLGLPVLFRGLSSMGRFMQEALMALRYLADRDDVRADHLLVSGNSGGGTQSSILAAICPDVTAVAPGTYISSRKGIFDSGVPQDAEQCIPAVTGRAWDHSDLLLLIAPRPCLILAAEDDFFPLPATKRTVAESINYWPKEHTTLELFVDKGGHRYSDAMAHAAVAFFQRQLELTKSTTREEQVLPLTTLNCSEHGQILRDRPSTQSWAAYESHARQDLRQKRKTISRESAVNWLSDRVFNGRPKIATLHFTKVGHEVRQVERVGTVLFKYVIWESCEGIHNYGCHLYRCAGETPTAAELESVMQSGADLYYKLVEDPADEWTEGDAHQRTLVSDTLAAKLNAGWQLFLHVPMAAGPLSPEPIGNRPLDYLFGAKKKLAMDLISAGDSLAAIRVYNVWTFLNGIKDKVDSGKIITITSTERFRFYIKLAGMLGITGEPDAATSATQSMDDFAPPRCYQPDYLPEIIIPGILQYLDADELCERITVEPKRKT